MILRPDSYSEWLVGLAEGDEVVVKMIWELGNPRHRAWVERKSFGSVTVHWMTFNDAEHGIGKRRATFNLPGGGNTEVSLLHPTRKVVYHPVFGYEFEDRIEHFEKTNQKGNPL